MRKHTPCASTLSLFAGKVCPDCRVWNPYERYVVDKKNKDGRGSYCPECRRTRIRNWMRVYRASLNRPPRVYKKKVRTPEEIERTKVLHAKLRRDWRMRNPNYSKEWNAKNPELRQAYTRKTRQKSRAALSMRERLRNAKKRSNGGSFTAAEWFALCEKYGHRCLCCGEAKRLTMDHVVPVSKGGTSYIDNIQPLCVSCNSRKHDKTIDYRY